MNNEPQLLPKDGNAPEAAPPGAGRRTARTQEQPPMQAALPEDPDVVARGPRGWFDLAWRGLRASTLVSYFHKSLRLGDEKGSWVARCACFG